MALPKSLCDREQDKFDLNSLGETCVRTCSEITGNVDAQISAPTGPFLITTKTVTDTASLAIATSLTSRVSLSIRNLSASNTVYAGPANTVTADSVVGTTSGWEIGPNEDFNIDLDATQSIYLIAESGKTATVKVLEIAST